MDCNSSLVDLRSIVRDIDNSYRQLVKIARQSPDSADILEIANEQSVAINRLIGRYMNLLESVDTQEYISLVYGE